MLAASLLPLVPGCLQPAFREVRSAPALSEPATEPLAPTPDEASAAATSQGPRRGSLPARHAFLLRIPHDLRDELRAWSDEELRSINAQIEFLLREAVERRRHGIAAGEAASL